MYTDAERSKKIFFFFFYHQRKNSKLLSSVKLQPVYQNASYELK